MGPVQQNVHCRVERGVFGYRLTKRALRVVSDRLAATRTEHTRKFEAPRPWAVCLLKYFYGQVAQLVERSPEKAGVGGSIPSLATI
jgi:hypothetical protein